MTLAALSLLLSIVHGKPHLAAVGLRHVFPTGLVSLDEFSLTIEPGEFVAIMGPSGCGKSTFLRLAAGLLAPAAGTLSVDGGGDLGFVFQSPTLLPWRSVRDNVLLPRELRGDSDAGLADRLIAEVGLAEFAGAYPRELSGGMRMRAAIARALAVEPSLLLLDEPFAAVDEITRQQLQDQLLAVWRKHRCTAIFVTHNVFEAVYLATRIIVVSPRPGRVIGEYSVSFKDRGLELRGTPEFAALSGRVIEMLRRGA